MSETQTILSHLIELRTRLIRIVIGLVITFAVLFFWRNAIFSFLARPLLHAMPNGEKMIAIDVTAALFVPTKVSMLVAFLLSLPNTLYQSWAFVAPALYHQEKRFILPLVLSSVILFFVGMCFVYFGVFPLAFHFLNATTPDGVAMMTDIDKYFSFLIVMFIAFGAAFEVPVVVILLTRFGVVSVQKLSAMRPYVIVAAFTIAAIITPPDVFSQVALAIPLWLLYEIGLLISRVLAKKAD